MTVQGAKAPTVPPQPCKRAGDTRKSFARACSYVLAPRLFIVGQRVATSVHNFLRAGIWEAKLQLENVQKLPLLFQE